MTNRPTEDASSMTSSNFTGETQVSSDLMALQIKSLEQRTHSVTVPRTSSVLQLKNEIQTVFDVDTGRQRLIFQGRVLKDDKQLTDYANLDSGKVIHLVVRPADAPSNPQNDEPRTQNTPRRTFGRTFSRAFPSFSSRLPTMEGYAFITLDTTLADVDNNFLLSQLLHGNNNSNLGTTTGSPGGLDGLPRMRFMRNTDSASRPASTGAASATPTTAATPGDAANTADSSPSAARPQGASAAPTNFAAELLSAIPSFEFSFGSRSSADFFRPSTQSPSAPATTTGANRPAMSLPFPTSVEVRLSRTLSSIQNVRSILEAPLDQDISGISTASTSSQEQMQDIRNRLRASGNTQTAQVGMVLEELANLMTSAAPRLREVAAALQEENRDSERELYRRVLRTARVVQGMSLVHHFLGSVLGSADINTRRVRRFHSNTDSSSPATAASETTTPSQSERQARSRPSAATAIRTPSSSSIPPVQSSSSSNASPESESSKKRSNAQMEAEDGQASTASTTASEDDKTKGKRRKSE
ncbi:uncharacterized protein BYT42DRAFT_615461 [Radiomyces spectabilis]|uniref:uncharacterized protein n=1 Tax=Radiomyces spectabilis TaxID=64574 RepID=UPI00221F20E5|nr:uncharacterized protein BYT42DRAFT_615461 [Radiomyces spectabilis]KAI8374287.1 hypothetical protein BYT42DRAFT_615461 [Radiomyces spectabilis]